MIFFSVDPGLTNVGWCYGTISNFGNTLVQIYITKCGNDVVTGSAKYDTKTFDTLITFWLSKIDVDPNVFLIEHQYWNKNAKPISKKLALFENLLCANVQAKDAEVIRLNSKHYKSDLGLATKQGNKANKVRALEFTKALLSDSDYEKHIGTCHHIADAINQVYYYAKHAFKDVPIQMQFF